jgi:3'-phosphoadenosine 5'-phosphosulfate sulfotransferase (PAPS reductase)/FAD synthetase
MNGDIEIEAARILNKHKFTVLWSGGKDSTAALLWVLDNVNHKNWNILYVEMTGNTHPLCTEYVLKTAEKLGLTDKLMIVKTADFYELMSKWGPPLLLVYRWCLYQLKLKAFSNAYTFVVDGIRRADSKVRRKLRLINVMKLSDKISVSPLINWSKRQVLQYIKQHGIELNPCYAKYGHSGNCMFCPYADKRHIILTMSDPEWRGKILSVFQKHREKMARGSIGREIYRRWIKNSMQSTLERFIEG